MVTERYFGLELVEIATRRSHERRRADMKAFSDEEKVIDMERCCAIQLTGDCSLH